jgi:CheY-like chemotaxis protein
MPRGGVVGVAVRHHPRRLAGAGHQQVDYILYDYDLPLGNPTAFAAQLQEKQGETAPPLIALARINEGIADKRLFAGTLFKPSATTRCKVCCKKQSPPANRRRKIGDHRGKPAENG